MSRGYISCRDEISLGLLNSNFSSKKDEIFIFSLRNLNWAIQSRKQTWSPAARISQSYISWKKLSGDKG